MKRKNIFRAIANTIKLLLAVLTLFILTLIMGLNLLNVNEVGVMQTSISFIVWIAYGLFIYFKVLR